ncbi:flagellar basal body-associated protein FliL [Desertibacillus haloalkaliphilus]|uniref:flagellar basal body-associated protein FliL n=1 Tax=Desertibacillus haloalkaliphilus TaxID=1328930 RepID=UPI001C25352C|nr:flagellar basal body-associated protein FliL [Desertibacillus haloalkaliphilus]MBU8907004.1 flagellar basal body-associated protein FliL [Desertibacillus haloalkaliphilus]
MFKNKLVNIMLIIILALTLVGVVTLVLINHFSKEDTPSEPTIDDIIELSVDTEEITTNLLSNDFARIQFRIQVDNKKAKSELEKRDFQVSNIVIRELAGLQASQLSGPDGIEALEDQVQLKVNQFLQEGSVVHVYTTTLMIQ